MYGSMHYVATHPDHIRRTVAAMAVDTPAAPYDLAGTEYTFYMNPHAAKSYTDAFVLHIASLYLPTVGRPWHWREFMTGTDTYLAEPTVGIPTVWPYSGTGITTHHNSEDTPDKVDPRSLRDLSIINATYLYYLANSGEAETLRLSELTATRGYEQILGAASTFIDQAYTARTERELGRVLARGIEKVNYSVERESQSVLSVLRLVPDDRKEMAHAGIEPLAAGLVKYGRDQTRRLEDAVNRRAGQLGVKGQIVPQAESDPTIAEASHMVVRRKRFGTIPLDEISPDDREGFPSGAWDGRVIAALYWCDGHRTLAEVIRLTRLELGEDQFNYVGYFKFLQSRGYVDLTTAP